MKDKRMKRRIVNPLSMLCFGLAIGAAARLLDIFTTNLGEVFSQMAVWILMGTLIPFTAGQRSKRWEMFWHSAWGCW